MSSTGIKMQVAGWAQSQTKLHALLVEDNALDAALVVRALNKDGFDVVADLVQDQASKVVAGMAGIPNHSATR